MTKIELLAPARTAAIAREAILHGADAVYIGAPRFGARAAAGNSMDDIRSLVTFAHLYRVKVYVTLNTLLFDDELEAARQLAIDLYEAGVDALIVQDMALLEMDLPPIALHASTQMDNRSADKVAWLRSLGFSQAVLARELTISEISDIHRQVPDMPLEVFVHGATCVSYNGQCYASQYCFQRSANRGECAQFCRLPFDLVDNEGQIVHDGFQGRPVRQRHVLSLRDMNRSDDLEALLDAGVVSLKIEGRLKDESYVKNVTSYYRQRLDEIIHRRPNDYQRASLGDSSISFTPDPVRTFNRGFSDYFLHGRKPDMVQLVSPKSLGQPVGHVKEIRRGSFTVSGTVPFSNGDGLCYVDSAGHLQGVRINRVEGNCLFPKDMPSGLLPRMPLFRNYDQQFLSQLSHPTAKRQIPVRWVMEASLMSGASGTPEETGTAIILTIQCEDGIGLSCTFPIDLSPARTPQYENICRQLGKLGDTPFSSQGVEVRFSQDWFIPSSTLSEWRRKMVESLIQKRLETYQPERRSVQQGDIHFVSKKLDFRANIANHLARRFYQRQGATDIEPALEVGGNNHVGNRPIMSLRYCPKHELGLCGKRVGQISLRSSDGKVFPLEFDCQHCLVYVHTPISK